VIEPKFTYEIVGETTQRGEVSDRPGTNVIAYYLKLANDKSLSHLQRVSALIVLFQMGVNVKFEVEEDDGTQPPG
jgi:hypothetical protein